MSQVLDTLKYLETHEWCLLENGIATVGITDHAQEMLGDVVYVELPEIGDQVDAGEECAVVESVKAASDIYSPLSGEVVAINEALADTPELINQSPYGDGWLFKIRPSDAASFDKLLDAKAYSALLAEEEA
jgi:glycine cleavage system H protein